MSRKEWKLTIGVLLLILSLPIAAYFYFTGGKGAYKLSLTRGTSKTMKESIARGVFLYELDYRIQPDSIKFIKSPRFFLEKGFLYGEWRSSDTVIDDSLPYKIFSNDYNFLFSHDLWLDGYGWYDNNLDTWSLYHIKDTIRLSIMTKTPPYDSAYHVGELQLFKKKSLKQ